MSELFDSISKAVPWDQTRIANVRNFINFVESDEDTEVPIPIFVYVGQEKSIGELRLSYTSSAVSLGQSEVLVISRSKSTDAIAETIADIFRIEGKRTARVVRHHQLAKRC